MIKILHVIDSLDLGGAQTALLNLVRFRDRERFQLTVALMHGRGVFAGALEKEDIEVVSLSAGRWPPSYLHTLPRLLRRGRFDVAHFHLFGSNWIGKPLAALCGVRVRVNHDQCNDRVRHLALDRATNLLSSHIFAVSESTRATLVGLEKISPAKITLLPNAVDTDRFRPPTAAERSAARGELGLPRDGTVVAGLGRLHPQKNWPLFLRLAARFPEVPFVIAGTGPQEGQLRAQAPANVHFAGFRDARTVLAASDVFLLTSDYEGTPMTLLEAMACGLPSVVSEVDGCAEILADRAGGLTAPAGDDDAFTAQLGEVLGDPERRARLGAAARERARQAYNARVQTRAVEETYVRLLAGGKAKSRNGVPAA
jgi:glycosyltransferase involved in cell wall biosynthesis